MSKAVGLSGGLVVRGGPEVEAVLELFKVLVQECEVNRGGRVAGVGGSHDRQVLGDELLVHGHQRLEVSHDLPSVRLRTDVEEGW